MLHIPILLINMAVIIDANLSKSFLVMITGEDMFTEGAKCSRAMVSGQCGAMAIKG